MSRKGPTYERKMCRILSLWWSYGERDDLIWRTAGSGGRATVRGKKGKKTYGHGGDICSTHPDADPLTRVLTIEIKKGYSKDTLVDSLDKPKLEVSQEWEKWHAKTIDTHTRSGTFSWIIVHQRDRRVALVYMPHGLFYLLVNMGCFEEVPVPFATIYFQAKDKSQHKIHAMKLDDFLECVDPYDIQRIAAQQEFWR